MMNRREFVRDGALALMAMGLPSAFAFESGDPEIEKQLAEEVLRIYEKLNPIDPKTGRRKFVSVGYVSDLHKCKRIAGDDAETDPKMDYWYRDTLTDCEPSIRLLGAVAQKAGLDGVIHAGDFSTAYSRVPFKPGEYVAEIRNVKAMFDKYLPKTPFFTVDGNHDRDYWSAKKKTGNRMNETEWREVQKFFNTDVSKNPEVDFRMMNVGTSYTLDFKRLLKSGGKNVRIVIVSLYDKCPGADPVQRAADGLVFSGDVTPENTLVGLTAHEVNGKFLPVVRKYLDEHKGAGYFGMICGHMHWPYTAPSGEGFKTSKIVVTRCFCKHGDKTREACRFSLFVFDTEKNKLREIRLAGGNERYRQPNAPKELAYDIDVG